MILKLGFILEADKNYRANTFAWMDGSVNGRLCPELICWMDISQFQINHR